MKHFQYFNLKELFSNCDDGEVLSCVRSNCVDSLCVLLVFLDAFRDYIESPIVITSSFRSVDHNKSVGGVFNSQHLLGQAIDFITPKMPISHTQYRFREFCQKSALTKFIGQVIFYPNFIHIGMRTSSHKEFYIYEKRSD